MFALAKAGSDQVVGIVAADLETCRTRVYAEIQVNPEEQGAGAGLDSRQTKDTIRNVN